MRFDEFWEEEDNSVREADRPLPPDGKATVLVSEVSLGTAPWARSDRNPDGRCLKIKLDVGRQWRPITDTVPLHWRAKLTDICRSARVRPPARGEDWDEQSLRGQHAVVDLTRAVSDRGTEYVRVDRWHEQQSLPPSQPAAPPAAAQPQAGRRKATAASGGTDDVPF